MLVLRQLLNYQFIIQKLLSTSGEPTNKLKLVEPLDARCPAILDEYRGSSIEDRKDEA